MRNELQLALCRPIADTAYFQAVGGHARWLFLAPGIDADANRGDHSLALSESSALIDNLGGLLDWRARTAALRSMRMRIRQEFKLARPDVVVLANDRPFAEQAVIEAAREAGVPSVLIQDGFIPTWHDLGARDRLRLLAGAVLWRLGIKVVGAPRPGLGSTDFCGVMGGHWRKLVRTKSGRQETVHVIGQPLFDSTIRAAADTERVRHEPSGKRVALFIATDFSNGFGDARAAADQIDDIRTLHAMLREAFGEHFELRVRPHPHEDDRGFESLHDLIKTRIDSSSRLEDAVLDADVVVSNISSASLVGIAVRIPTLAFTTHFHRGGYRRLFQMYPCLRATDREAALRMLRRLGDPFDRAQWVAQNAALAADYLYVDPGQTAAELAVLLIAEAARRQSLT